MTTPTADQDGNTSANLPHLSVGDTLPEHSVVAFNYAHDSDNKIHDDQVAKDFGFGGGLVPGVADYAYMTQPLVHELGSTWLERGWADVRFRSPVYEDDTVRACARVTGTDPLELALELHDSGGVVCAAGTGGVLSSTDLESLSVEHLDYPRSPLPPYDERPAATLEHLHEGFAMGSLPIEPLDRVDREALLDKYRDPLELYRRDDAPVHPAFIPDAANSLLTSNVELGPWIHTGSRVQHVRGVSAGAQMELRGTVAASYERKGHDVVELQLGLFTRDDEVVALIRHTAIIRVARRDHSLG